ncbi:MAG: WD40 repeat domain-containing protein [Chloroflexota bacterium]|nr:WD40 repeat domain-containing protein [Chloroflexota bacterium]
MRKRITFVVSFLVAFFYLTVHSSAQTPQYVNLALQLSPNGETIALGRYNGELILYDADSRNVLHTFQDEHDIYDLQWSPDGGRIAAVSYFGNVKVWDTISYELQFSVDLSSNIVFRVNWSPDGSQLAITSAEAGTTVLSAATGSKLYHLQTGDTSDSLWSLSPHLITADLVGLRVWQEETELSRILGTVNGVINGNLPSRIAVSSVVNSIAVYGSTAPTVDSSGMVSDGGSVLQTCAFPSLDLLKSIVFSLPEQIAVMRL